MTERHSIPSENRKIWLCLEPLDTLFFRDGRPFGPASRVQSGLPNPQTLAGALHTELLRRAGVDLQQLAGSIRGGDSFETALSRIGGDTGKAIAQVRFQGPYFGQKKKAGARDRLVYPAPATLRYTEENKKILRLDPLDPMRALPPGWTPRKNGMVPLWPGPGHKRFGEQLKEKWITTKGMECFLSGGTPSRADLIPEDQLYGFEDRTGIAVKPDTGTAEDGMIYATRRLVLRQDVRLWAHVEGPDAALGLLPQEDEHRLLPLGGEGRQVIMSARQAEDAPRTAVSPPPCTYGAGISVVLVSPAFLNGWHPGPDLLAAAVPGHVPVSGWDLARDGPKATRFAVVAGSVYFLQNEVKRLSDRGIGLDTNRGWGNCLLGVWNHA